MVPALIFGTCVLVTLEFIVIGILPLLAGSLDVPLNRAGWLVSSFAVSAAVLGPLLILLTSRLQPATALAMDLLIVGASSLLPLVLPGFWLLLATRIAQGALLTHFISLASATAAQKAGERNAGKAVGQVNLGVIFGTVFAVPAGVALADRFGWELVFTGLGVMALVGAVLIWLSILDVGPAEQVPGQAGILRKPRFLIHLIFSGMVFTAMFSSYSYIAGYLEQAAGFTSRDIALALFAFGAAGILGNALASRWVGRSPVMVTLLVSLILVLVAACMSVASASMAGLVLVLLVWGAAHTAAFVTCQVRVMFAEQGAPAFAASLNISVCNLGIAAGAAIGGKVIAAFGIGAVWLGTVIFGVVSLAVGLVLVLWRVEAGQKSASSAAEKRMGAVEVQDSLVTWRNRSP